MYLCSNYFKFARDSRHYSRIANSDHRSHTQHQAGHINRTSTPDERERTMMTCSDQSKPPTERWWLLKLYSSVSSLMMSMTGVTTLLVRRAMRSNSGSSHPFMGWGERKRKREGVVSYGCGGVRGEGKSGSLFGDMEK